MATKKAAKKGTSDAMLAAEIGAGVLAAGAAAAAGYYFYGDKNAKKHRQAASKWAKGMKAEVVKEAKKVNKFDQKVAAAIIDRAAGAYAGVRSIDQQDVKRAAAELKKHWRMIEQETASVRAKMQAAAKKASKKAPKKAAKKSVKKSAPKKAAKKSTKKR